MVKAKEVYTKLMVVYNSGDRQLDSYINVLKAYVDLKQKWGTFRNGINQVYTRNGKDYTMFNMFIGDTGHLMFIEDATMMVYRLYGGEGYNTYTLIDTID